MAAMAADQLTTQTRPGELCMDPPGPDAVAATSTVYSGSDAQPVAAVDGHHESISLLPFSLLPFSPPPSPAPLQGQLRCSSVAPGARSPPCLEGMPDEILILIASFLDVDDLLSTSRTCHSLRKISLDPIVHLYRLRSSRLVLTPLLTSPGRPSLSDLVSRSIFLTNNTVISRRLARSLVSIRLARRLASRPSPELLVQRCVLPRECVPGLVPVLVAPALVAKRKAIEKERLKDGLRRWIACKWTGEVKEREEDARRCDESHGVGRVWKLRRFWEKVSRGDVAAR